jgi:DNA-binding MarR family transcriptional regulator
LLNELCLIHVVGAVSMIRSTRTTNRLKKIFLSADEGASYELPNDANAINLRQKLYHFKRAILKKGKHKELKEIALHIVVKISGNTLHVSTSMGEDYMDSLDEQL